MRISMSFKDVKHSSEVDQRLKEKTEKLFKYLEGKFSVKWHCTFKEGFHYSEVFVTGPKFSMHAHAKHPNLYKSFDLTLDKIERQVSRKKNKIKSRRLDREERVHHPDPEQVWIDHGNQDWDIAS